MYPFLVQLAATKNKKAALWIQGRKNIFETIANGLKANTHPIIWVHCASLGEFEQGRPVMEALRIRYPSYKILLTFFSPSGYEVQKQYKGADYVFYLPMDGLSNAKRFFSLVRPAMVLFIKYEFWYYYLQEAKQQQIPLLLISGVFRAQQPFFKWYGAFHRSMLQCFTHLFLQENNSYELLQQINSAKNITVSGDTRFDRVKAIAQNFAPVPLIADFIGNSKAIVAGSTWLEDDKELAHFVKTHSQLRFIIAPHDVQKSRIDECLHLYKNAITFSRVVAGEMPENNCNVLIIDNVGMLSRLYAYATVCYVGGGFGSDGVHNVLEAAVYGKPVVFGNEYDKFKEAIELLEVGGGFSVENALELEKTFETLLYTPSSYTVAANAASQFVSSKTGATQKIMDYIQEKRLLTN